MLFVWNLSFDDFPTRKACQGVTVHFLNVTKLYTLIHIFFSDKPVIIISSNVNTCNPQRSPSGVCAVSRGHNITIVCKSQSNPPPSNTAWSGQVRSRTDELQLVSAEPMIHDGHYECAVQTEALAGDDRLPLSSSYQFDIVVQGNKKKPSFNFLFIC